MAIGEKSHLAMGFLLSILDDRQIEGPIGVIGDEPTIALKSRTGRFHDEPNRFVVSPLNDRSEKLQLREIHR